MLEYSDERRKARLAAAIELALKRRRNSVDFERLLAETKVEPRTVAGGPAAGLRSRLSVDEVPELSDPPPQRGAAPARRPWDDDWDDGLPRRRRSLTDDEEEEELLQPDRCRFCSGAGAIRLVNGTTTEALVSPCECSGEDAFCHFTCLKAYYVSRADLTDLSCPICNAWYTGRYGTQLGEHGAHIAETQHLPALQVGAVLNSLALAYDRVKDHARSVKNLNLALSALEEEFGRDHPHIAATLANMGEQYVLLGQQDRGVMLLEQAAEIWRKAHESYPEAAGQFVDVCTKLAAAQKASGDREGERANLERVLKLLEKAHGRKKPAIVPCMLTLADAYGALSRHVRQVELLDRALAIWQREHETQPAAGGMVVEILEKLARVYAATGARGKERDVLERALAMKQKAFGPGSIELAETMHFLGLAYGSLGSQQKERNLLQKVLTIVEREYGPESHEVGLALVSLGDVFARLEEPGRAHAVLQRALAIFERGGSREDVQDLRNALFLLRH